MKTYATFLPVFTGFYNTIFEPCEDSEIEYINEEREKLGLEPVKWEDIKFNYKEYMDEVAKLACGHVEYELNDLGIQCIVKFESLYSPREYNFTNDSINCSIEIDKNAVLKYLIDNKEDLKQYFLNKFTSCSGFISFNSNNIDHWIDELRNDELNEDKLGFILDAIMLNENQDAELNMYYSCDSATLMCENFDELTTISE